ncbi:MAG: DUF4203 domain-containing protein [Ruthenibacterium sp.]
MEKMTTFAALGAVITILWSLLHCFFGYKLQKIWVALMSFVVGGVLGYIIAALFTPPTWVPWIAALALGVIFVLISFKLYLMGVFLLSFVLFAICMQSLIPNETIMWIVIVVGGILLGILAVKFTRPVLIFATALGGGLTAAKSILMMTGVTALLGTQGIWLYLPVAAGVVLAGLGMWFQYKTTHKGA